MNKNLSITKTGAYLIFLIVVLIAYIFIYFLPAQNQLQTLQSEIALYNAETAVYREYLADPSILEAEIAAVQTEIDRMNAEDYTNDSNVSFIIGDAIQRFDVSLSSVSLSEESDFNDHRALPINISLSGELNNVYKFVDYFEHNQNGSFLVQNVSIKLGKTNATATMVIYLCTPNL